jgi:hypothetical protein
MQLLTIVYRYSEDRYLLAADGGLLGTFRVRTDAELVADAIRDLNLAGYTVTGENPQNRPGEPYGRLFIERAIGPRLPRHLLPRATVEELVSLTHPSTIGRSLVDSMSRPYLLVEQLRQLDPDDRGLVYAAERNDSADYYRDMIGASQLADPARYVHPDNLSAWVSTIADLCVEDGADRGFIPLIGDTPRAVWEALYSWLTRKEGTRAEAVIGRSAAGY